MRSPQQRSLLVLGAAVLVLTGCGADAPTESAEYVALSDEHDELQAALDETETELDAVDDALAVAEANLADAEAEVTALEDELATATARDQEYGGLLQADLQNRVGMPDEQATCVSEAFMADDDARQAYLFLIEAEGESEAANDAIETVTAVFDECGLDMTPAEAEPATVPGAEALGEVTVSGAALPRFDDTVADAAIGVAAPVVVGADYEREPVTIDAAANGPTMVMVLAHWCPHCNAEIPRINQLRDEGRVPDGVEIVAISSAISPDRPNYPPGQWIEDVDWTYPVIADGIDTSTGVFLAADAFGTSAFPYVILIDGDGNVVDRWAGERDLAQVEAALRSLADG